VRRCRRLEGAAQSAAVAPGRRNRDRNSCRASSRGACGLVGIRRADHGPDATVPALADQVSPSPMAATCSPCARKISCRSRRRNPGSSLPTVGVRTSTNTPCLPASQVTNGCKPSAPKYPLTVIASAKCPPCRTGWPGQQVPLAYARAVERCRFASRRRSPAGQVLRGVDERFVQVHAHAAVPLEVRALDLHAGTTGATISSTAWQNSPIASVCSTSLSVGLRSSSAVCPTPGPGPRKRASPFPRWRPATCRQNEVPCSTFPFGICYTIGVQRRNW